jgi:hypothetical protein
MAGLVAERLDVDLTTTAIRVDLVIPIEEYDRYGELDPGQQEAWLDVIREDLEAIS